MAHNELFYEYDQPHVIAQRCEQELKALSDDSNSLMKLSHFGTRLVLGIFGKKKHLNARGFPDEYLHSCSL